MMMLKLLQWITVVILGSALVWAGVIIGLSRADKPCSVCEERAAVVPDVEWAQRNAVWLDHLEGHKKLARALDKRLVFTWDRLDLLEEAADITTIPAPDAPWKEERR